MLFNFMMVNEQPCADFQCSFESTQRHAMAPLKSNQGCAHLKTILTVEEINKIWKFCLLVRCRWQLGKWLFVWLHTCAKELPKSVSWGNQVRKASLQVSHSLQPLTLRLQETGLLLENHWDSLTLPKAHYWAFFFIDQVVERALLYTGIDGED